LPGAALLAIAALVVIGCAPKEQPLVITSEEAKVGRFGAWTAVPVSETPYNILIITLDTTRRDRFSCYGFDKPTTPHIDSLAADGVIFEKGFTPIPVTLPAHATILTGFYPYQHGVRNNGTYVLDERHTTLAEVLRARGYRTGAIAGAFPVDHRFGLGQGFEAYEDSFPAESVGNESDTAQRRAGEVTRLALEWIRQTREGLSTDQPFFLWTHYFDPHYPYDPPEPYRSKLAGDLYAGEVSYTDACIGELIEGLKADGLYDRTAILIVGDHGESLGEHEEATHSIFIYNSTQEVPYVLRLPADGPFADAKWRGRRSSELACLTDCFPTLLNIAGVPEAERPLAAGQSLLPVIEGTQPGHAWIYQESLVPKLEYAWSDLRGLITPRWRYVRAPRPELYDQVKDVDELRDLSQSKAKVAAGLDDALSAVLKMDAGGESGQVAMDQETVERLRSLGYMAGASMQKSAGPAKDPKDMIVFFEMLNAARTLMARHRPAEALAITDSVLAVNPDDGTAARLRASCLVRLGRGEDAIAAYDRLLSECDGCPDHLDLIKGRIGGMQAAGRPAEAAAEMRRLIDATPHDPDLRLMLSRALQEAGDLPGALQALDEELKLRPKESTIWAARGEVLLAMERPRPAEESYRQAIALNARNASALANLAELLVNTNREEAARGYVQQALAADPFQFAALFRQAWFLRKDGRSGDAVQMYLKALSVDPDNFRILYNLGNLYLDLGNLTGAEEVYAKAISLAAEAPSRTRQQLLANLGVVYARTGKMSQAITYWERAVEVDPTSERAQGIRGNIQMARRGGMGGPGQSGQPFGAR